jgi:hypothetical protein
MNYYAAKAIGFDYPIAEDEICVNKETLTIPEMIQTAIHEVVEAQHMEFGLSYWQAHKLAAKAELDPENIKTMAEVINKLL